MNPLNVLEKNQELLNIHSGKCCFILASGPSINSQDLLLVKDEISIAVNKFYHHQDIKDINPPYWVCADPLYCTEQETYLTPLIKGFEENEIHSKVFFPLNFGFGKVDVPKSGLLNLYYYKYGFTQNMDDNIDFTREIPPYGQNVVLVAIMLAFFLGCNPIYLAGCDHSWWAWKREAYHNLFTPQFFDQARPIPISKKFSFDALQSTIWVQKFQYLQLKKYAEKRGIQIFNATDGGYLECFPRVKYEDLFIHGNRSITIESMLSAIPDVASVLGATAVKLINEGELVSALVLINEAIQQNTGKVVKVDGLDYLLALCLMELGEYRQAIRAAKQDYLLNPSNRERSTALLTALGDDLAIAPDVLFNKFE